MAPLAADTLPESHQRNGTLPAKLLRLLGPHPGRLAFAVRLALICAVTALVVEIYQTPDPALTVYIGFFLIKPDRVESLVLCAIMAILMSAIIGLVILMAMVVIDAPLWRVALMTAFSFGFLFIAFASKLRPLAGTITLIVGYALDLLGTLHFGEIATRALLYAWLFVTIPAGVSVVVNLLLAPPPRRLAERAIAHRLRAAAAVLRDRSERTWDALTECLREGMGEIDTWLKLAGAEKTSPPRDIAALRQAAQSTTAILSWVDVVSRDPASLLSDSQREQLARTLDDMALILNKGGYPVDITLEAGEADSAPSAHAWVAMGEILSRFTEPAPPETPAMRSAPRAAGFFLPDAFTNPEYVHYALKTTAAAMFCYVLYSLLDWPGIHTCFITCYIVSLGTTAETVEKLSLRLAGGLVGAAVGIGAIVYLMPSLTTVGALLAVVFIGALAPAWVAAGSARISYAGFQIAFAFFLCVIQGPAPAFDLTIARDRVIGILLGNIVVYLLFTRAWPTGVGTRVDPSIASVLRNLSGMTGAVNVASQRSMAAQVQGALGNIEQDLELSRYEPATIRPGERWLQGRLTAVRTIRALQGPLLVSARLDPAFAAEAARRLERSADLVGARVEGFDEALILIQSLASESAHQGMTGHASS